MSRIKEEIIQEIRQKVKIEDVIARYIPVEKHGNSYKCVCPFHDDHDPSMSISPTKQIFKCFVCNQGGNVFNFVQQYENISFADAVATVGSLVGIEVDVDKRSTQPQRNSQEKRLYEVVSNATQFMNYELMNSTQLLVKDFLKQRSITDKMCEQFKIGYNDQHNKLTNYLLKKGFKPQECIDAYLSRLYDSELVDIFEQRIVFPIFNEYGEPIAFSGRTLLDNQAKYINSATTKLYQKSDILYNYHHVKQAKFKDDPLILCEGVMDVIGFYRCNIEKCIATLGTALSDKQIALIKRLHCPVILAYDGDKAGYDAMYRIGQQLRKHHVHVSIYHNDTHYDPDELSLQNDGSIRLKAMVDRPYSWLQFVLNYGLKQFPNLNHDNKKQFVSMVLSQLVDSDPLDQDYFLSQLSSLTQFSVAALQNEMKKLNKPTKVHFRPNQTRDLVVPNQEVTSVELDVLSHLLAGKRFIESYFLNLGHLIHPEATDLAMKIIHFASEHETVGVADLLNMDLSDYQRVILLNLETSEVFTAVKTDESFLAACQLVLLNDTNSQLAKTSNIEVDDTVRFIQELEEIKTLQNEKRKLQSNKKQ